MLRKLSIMLCVLALVLGCKSNQELDQRSNQEIDFEEIKRQAAYHSKGLAFVRGKIPSTKSGDPIEGPGPELPPIGDPEPPTGELPLEEQIEIVDAVKDFAILNGWDEYAYLANVAFNVDSLETTSLVGTAYLRSYEYYKLALDIIHVMGENELAMRQQIDIIIGSSSFSALSLEEKESLVMVSEVLIDSYNFWKTEYGPLLDAEPLSSVNTKSWCGICKKIWKVVSKDASGVLAAGGAVNAANSIWGTGAAIGAAVIAAVVSSTKADKLVEEEPVVSDSEEDLEVDPGDYEEYTTLYFSEGRQLNVPKMWIEVLLPPSS